MEQQQHKPRFKLTEQEKIKILAELSKRVPELICPVCNQQGFTISDGYFTHSISAEIGSIVFGGLNVPTIALFCTNCGFMMEFSLGVLGMLPKPEPNVKIVREVPGKKN